MNLKPGILVRAVEAKLRTGPAGLYDTLRVSLRYEGRLIRWKMDLADWIPRGDTPHELELRRGSPRDLRLLTTRALPYDFHIGRVHGVEWCYLGFWEGRVAHITWIFTRHDRTPLINLQPGEVELRHVHTVDSFRGRGIFGSALQRILACLSDEGIHTVYAHVLEGNHASNHTFMKLGFRNVAIIGLTRTLGFNQVRVLKEEETSYPTP